MIPDMKKVLKGLSLCRWTSAGLYEGYAPDYETCARCPYRPVKDDLDAEYCSAKLYQDAIELLKEQEPVEPVRQWDDDETTWWYSCGSCVQAVDYKDKYCRHCGKGLKWDA